MPALIAWGHVPCFSALLLGRLDVSLCLRRFIQNGPVHGAHGWAEDGCGRRDSRGTDDYVLGAGVRTT